MTEKQEYQTTRIWASTLAKLRMIYALTGETQVSIIDRLADAELERLHHEQAGRPGAEAQPDPNRDV